MARGASRDHPASTAKITLTPLQSTALKNVGIAAARGGKAHLVNNGVGNADSEAVTRPHQARRAPANAEFARTPSRSARPRGSAPPPP